MKKGNSLPIIIFIGAVLTIAGTVYFVKNSNDFNWFTSYLPDNKDPYGTFVIRQMLEETNDIERFEFIDDSTHIRINGDKKSNGNSYIFIGNEFYAEKKDMSTLLEFISSGNDVFISANNYDDSFYYYLYNYLNDRTISKQFDPFEFQNGYTLEAEEDDYEEYQDYEDYEDYEDYDEYEEEVYYDYGEPVYYNIQEFASEVSLNLDKPFGYGDANVSLLYDFDTIPCAWTCFGQDFFNLFEKYKVERLGHLHATSEDFSNYTNFVSISIGEGKIYLHSTPILFTNYYMKNENYMRFAEKHLSFLDVGNLYWAEENRKYIYEDDAYNKNNKEVAGESALEFILSEPGLRWAYYLALLFGLMYLIFGARRKQRVIPVQLSPENTSIEYAEVVSQLFFKQSDHYKLIQMKMDLFRSHLLDKYGIRIPTDLNERDKFYKVAAIKTGVDPEQIKKIFMYYTMAEASKFADAYEMVQFHKSLEIFYQISR